MSLVAQPQLTPRQPLEAQLEAVPTAQFTAQSLPPMDPLPLTPPPMSTSSSSASSPIPPFRRDSGLSMDDDLMIPPPCYVEPPSYFSALGIAPGSSRPARYACVTISGTDRLRLVNFPNEDIADVIEVVDTAITNLTVVQSRTAPRQRVFEWKLKGRPWAGDGWNDLVAPVRLLSRVFGGLSATGYHVSYASDISCGRDTVFVKQGPKVSRTVFALTFRRPGTMVLVDAPPIVQNFFINTLASWHGGAVGMDHQAGHVKIELGGQLWPSPTEFEAFAVRELLCNLLAVFDELGYDKVASFDMSRSAGWANTQSSTPDSMFFANRPSPTASVASPSSVSLSPSPVSTPSIRSV